MHVQSCPTLCDPMNCSLPGSSVQQIFQARILEWFAIPSPGDLPDPGIQPGSPALQGDSLPAELPGKPYRGHIGESNGLAVENFEWRILISSAQAIIAEADEWIDLRIFWTFKMFFEILFEVPRKFNKWGLKSLLIQEVIFFPYYLIRVRLAKYILKV